MLAENERYKQLVVEPGTVIPEVRDDYPVDDPYAKMYQPEYIRNLTFDAEYPYIDDSLEGRWWRWLGSGIMLYGVLWPMLRWQVGLKIEGRHWLKKYKKELKGGAITIANHCHRHDAEAVLIATWANLRRTRIPMFAANFNTKDLNFLKMVGGVPIPPAEMGMQAMKRFNEAFDEFHRRGYWFHIFPESRKWEYYKPLRPFQKGAFSMAYKYGMPIVPCTITWRERTGLWRLLGSKNMPLMTVKIGEPILPDTSAPRKEEVERLSDNGFKAILKDAGIVRNSW